LADGAPDPTETVAARRDGAHALVAPEDAGLPIVARGVAYVSGTTAILDGVDLDVARGRRLLVIGPNGSGKSTLLRLLHGLLPPTRGTLRWGSSLARPRNHAMVFQRPVLLRRSASANIAYALELANVRGAAADRRILAALSDVGLLGVGDRPARVLSGGEQQQLWAAHQPAAQLQQLHLPAR